MHIERGLLLMLIGGKKLKLRKGFTLVEAIVAAGILVLIASTTLIFLGFGNIQIIGVRDITENNFELVHDMELQTRSIRMRLDDSNFAGPFNPLEFYVGSEIVAREVELLGTLSSFTEGIMLFEDLFVAVNLALPEFYPAFPDPNQARLPGSGDRNIQVYLVPSYLLPLNPVNRMYSFIGQRPETYAAPEVEFLVAGFPVGSAPLGGPFENIVACPSTIGTLSADLTDYSFITEDDAGNDIWGDVNYQWWVSDIGFGTVLGKDGYATIAEGDFAWRLWPIFPVDFEPILGATQSTLSSGMILNEFRGRHIVLSATPFSNLGKMGDVVASFPALFIVGLPDISGLPVIHLNAGIIGRTVDDVTGIGEHINTGGSVRRWNDLRSPALGDSAQVQNPTLDFPLNMPGLFFQENGNAPNNTQFSTVEFMSVNTGGVLHSPRLVMDNRNNPPMNGITVFVVARRNDVPGSSNSIISGSQGATHLWELGFDEFTVQSGGGGNTVTVDNPGHSPDVFYVISGRFGSDPLTGINIAKHGLNGIEEYDDAPFNPPLFLGEIRIGNVSNTSVNFNASIAEIIIYDEKLSDAHFNEIVTYLMEKYSID